MELPENLKALYKTVWEIKQRQLVDMAADRGAYIDQSQSFNVHMSDVNFGKLTSLHFYGWKVRFGDMSPAPYYVLVARVSVIQVCMPVGMLSGPTV